MMKTRLITRSIVTYLLFVFIPLGILYLAFQWEWLEDDFILIGSLTCLVLAYLWLVTYRAIWQCVEIYKYYNTAESLGIKITYSWFQLAHSPHLMNSYDFDLLLLGGLSGEGNFQFNNFLIKILHIYQYKSVFFQQNFFKNHLITVFETKFYDPSINFIFRKKMGNKVNSIESKLMPGWEFFFYNIKDLKDQEKSLVNWEDKIPNFIFGEFQKLPGNNAILVQSGKIALIHQGIVHEAEEIKLFSKTLVEMTS